MTKARTNKGVDLNKIKKSVGSYPATLYIGNMSFDGKLSRMNNVSNKEIKQAIKEVLNELSRTELCETELSNTELSKTELEIGEAEALVERVAQEEKFTPEDMKEVRDNILKLVGGWDTYAKIYDLMRNEGESLEEIAIGAAGDAAQEKLLELMFKEAGGNISKVVDGIFICADQYAKDKEKWKNRADALNAKRMLKDFYEKVNEKIENKADSRPKGWSLAIEDTNRAYFSFYGIEGNCQTWNVSMLLNKEDSGKGGSGGTYTGLVDITVEYDMGPFDHRFMRECLFKKDAAAEMFCKAMEMAGFKYSDKYSTTIITRRLFIEKISIDIFASSTGISSTPINFSNFNDDKTIKIAHKVVVILDKHSEGDYVHIKHILNCTSNNKEKITKKFETAEAYYINSEGARADIQKATIPSIGNFIQWDSNIWKQWEKEKRLEICFPK